MKKTFSAGMLMLGLMLPFAASAASTAAPAEATPASGLGMVGLNRYRMAAGQMGRMGKDGMMGMMGGGMMNPAKVDAHLNELKVQLKLTPKQADGWTIFSDTVKGTAKAHMEKYQAMRAAGTSTTAPERMDKMLTMQRDRLAGMEKVTEAMKTFYGTLSTEQKSAFDRHCLHTMPAGKRGARGGMMPMAAPAK